MLSAEARQGIDQYWADQLAISPDLLHARALTVVPLPESSASFCFVFQHQAFTCVRVPASYYDDLHQAISPHDRSSLLTPAWWSLRSGTLLLTPMDRPTWATPTLSSFNRTRAIRPAC